MTDSDFEDAAEFDIKDISNILKDIDSVNLALDSLDGRADKLTASLASLLKAQSQSNPFVNVEATPLDEDETPDATSTSERTAPTKSVDPTPAPPPSLAASSTHSSKDSKSD
ncbi:hypothetical protein BGX23_011620 [Mortierella sp. AD031]|nr:hypothetical protein BGX23_011620 [Mortierella sp. AD031]